MFQRILILAVLFFLAFFLRANLPAPWVPCRDKNLGDPCTYGYGCANNGICKKVEDCKEDPKSKERRCVVCKTK